MNHLEIRSVKENLITMFLPTGTNSKVMYHPKNKVRFIESINHDAMVEALNKRGNELRVHLEHNTLIDIKKNVTWKEQEDGILFKVELQEGTEELRNKVANKSFGVSFGMSVLKDAWTKTGDIYKRVIDKLSISEISLVGNPAYNNTYSEIRSLDEFMDKENKRKQAKAKLYIIKMKHFN